MPLKPILTQKYLQECFDYVDGKLIWKVRPLEHFKTKRAFSTWNTRFAGKTAGYLHSSSYTKNKSKRARLFPSQINMDVSYRL